MDTGYRHPLLRVLVYSHLWLALGAMAQVWWVGRFVEGRGWRAMLAVGAALVAAYGIMRIVRSLGPSPIASPWVRWVARHRTVMGGLVVVAGAVALWAVWGLHRVFAPFDLLALPATVLYLVPWVDDRGRSLGLRQIPFLKAPLIAAVWALATTGLSEVPVTALARMEALEIATLQFSFFFALAIAFDGMDLPHDPKDLRTVPQWLGARFSRWLAVLLVLPWVVHLLLLYGAEDQLTMSLLPPTLGYVLAMILLALSGAQRPRWYGQLLVDGLLLFIPLLAASATCWH